MIHRRWGLWSVLLVVVGLTCVGAAPPNGGVVSAGTAQQVDATLSLVGQIGGTSFDVAVAGDTAFLGVGPRLVAFNVSAPGAPEAIAQSVVLDDVVMGIDVADGLAYVANGSSGLQVFDVHDPTALVWVGGVDVPGRANGVAVSAGHAYVIGENTGLRVIDVSDPTAPTETGAVMDILEDSVGWRLAVEGGHAFVGTLDGSLVVVDVTDPGAPVVAAGFGQPALDIVVKDHRAYVADAPAEAMHVLDLSEPTTPRMLGSVDLIGQPTAVALHGTYAYVAIGTRFASLAADAPMHAQTDHAASPGSVVAGLAVVDVSNQSRPRVVGIAELSGEGSSVAVAAGHAFLAANDASLSEPESWVEKAGGLRVVNVLDPSAPTEVAAYHSPGGMLRDLAVRDGHVFATGLTSASSYVGAVWSVDLETPSEPVGAGYLAVEGAPRGIVLNEDFAYVAEEFTSLMVLDVAEPSAPSLLTRVTGEPYVGHRALVVGDTLYVAEGDFYLTPYDLTDPGAPEPGEPVDSGGETVDVAHMDGYLYVAGGFEGVLQCYDLAQPLQPESVWVWEGPGPVLQVAVDRGHAFVAMGSSGLAVLDVSDAAAARQVAELAPDAVGDAMAVAIDGDRLYVVDGGGRVVWIDVSAPASPKVAASVDLPAYVPLFGENLDPFESRVPIAVSNELVYVSFGPSGLIVLQPVDAVAATPTASVATPVVTPPPPPTATTQTGPDTVSIFLPETLRRSPIGGR